MNPIYKFELTIGETTQRCFPIYKDDLAKVFELETNQQFFRAKLSGKLTFEKADYNRIVAAAFDTQFLLEIFISYDAGQTWTSYWSGTFWKTDCDFDGDAGTVQVTPTVNDQYNDVLAGMEKEYNLIELLPDIIPVKIDKRPMIQVYVPGQTVIGCFLSGMWWEQECESVLESDTVRIGNNDYLALTYKYHFALNRTLAVGSISGNMSPQLPELFTQGYTGNNRFNLMVQGTQDIASGDFTLRYFFSAGSGGATQRFQILRGSTVLWQVNITPTTYQMPLSLTLTPVSGSGASGDVSLYFYEIPVYARYVLDVTTISGLDTYELPTDDLVENNRNYHRAIGYAVSDVIYFSARLTATPTQWGLYQPDEYYQEPYLYWMPELFPVARAGWGRISIWFSFSAFDWITEEAGRAEYTLKDAFPLWSVISVLLNKIAPDLYHYETPEYSEFLYDVNPLTGINQTLLITPKSNIISAGYDQPAQKAPITLKTVLDMLRDCFRCYWFIDSQQRFRIEHIRYYMLGGTYSASPVVGTDLTKQIVTRNGKVWSFARNQYKFDKPEMAARYQFGWMDDVTELFDGFPIDIVSKYVNPDKIEQIDVSQFTSDIDYILLNPGEISKDGFVLLAAQHTGGTPSEIIELPWDAAQLYGNTRWYSFLSGTLRTGDTLTFKISDYTNYDISVYICQTKEYAGTMVYDTGWIATDFSKVIKPAENGCYVRVTIRRKNNGTINVPTGDSLVTEKKAQRYQSGTVGRYYLPYLNFNIHNTDHILQNAFVAFAFLQRYYSFDMPAYNYKINNETMRAIGIKKLKTQTLKFPLLTDPDLVKLVKTEIGNGIIQKLSVNLSSRNANATLKYDTE